MESLHGLGGKFEPRPWYRVLAHIIYYNYYYSTHFSFGPHSLFMAMEWWKNAVKRDNIPTDVASMRLPYGITQTTSTSSQTIIGAEEEGRGTHGVAMNCTRDQER